jgi:hypothetical protein
VAFLRSFPFCINALPRPDPALLRNINTCEALVASSKA